MVNGTFSIRELKKNIFIKNHIHYLLFFLLAYLLVFNFFPSGYILTLDMVISEDSFQITNLFYGLSESFSIAPFIAFLSALKIIMPVEYIEKLSFLFIFFISGISAYKLCPEEYGVGRYFAGFLYMLNPFIYVRFLAGHWLLLLAYAVTPIVVRILMDFNKTPSTKGAVRISFLLAFVFALETHTPFLLLIVLCVFFLMRSLELRTKSDLWNLSKLTLLIGIFLLLLNSYWLIPNFTGNSAPLSEITTSDLDVFTTRHDLNFNTLFTTASMYGFWRIGYINAKDMLPYWYLFFVFILYLAVQGFVSNYKHPQYGVFVKAFSAIAVIAVLLASGISGPFAGMFEFLFNNVFFIKGFREPQKFVALLVLAYSFLGGLGVAEFGKLIRAEGIVIDKKVAACLIIALALSIPFIYSFTMFNGFWGQLKPTDYPKDWYETNEFLNQDKKDFNVLFFPWHAYMDFKWLLTPQKRLANPASVFFDKPVIQGDNMEAGSIFSSSANPVSKYIEFLLSKRVNIENFGELITPLNVKYVLLTKEVDYKSYNFLYNQTDLEIVKDTENLVVFRNRHPVYKMYQVDSISTIRSWDDFLETSRKADIMDSAFVFGNRTDIQISQMKALNYSEEYPVLLKIELPALKYVVFTEKYSGDWNFGGVSHLANFGVTNVYDAARIDGLNLYYKRFNVYLVGYIISGITFILLIVIYYMKRKEKIITKR